MSTLRFIALGLGLAAVSAACSSTTTTDTTTPAPKPVCPDTVSSAIDPSSRCNTEGYLCPIGFQCGAFQQQAACTCTNHAWVCNGPVNDPTMAPFAAGDDLSSHCVPETQPADKCPTNLGSAQMACTKPTACCTTAGKACYYTGTVCAGQSQALTDVCTCETVGSFDGGVPYLQWVCNVSACH